MILPRVAWPWWPVLDDCNSVGSGKNVLHNLIIIAGQHCFSIFCCGNPHIPPTKYLYIFFNSHKNHIFLYSYFRSLACHWLSLVASFKAFTATIWTFWVIHSLTLPCYWWWLDVSFSLLPFLDAVAPLKNIIAWH